MTLPYKLRGSSNKERFLHEYELNCLAHIVLLPGQTQTCSCGNKDITSDYYVFSFKTKGTHEETDTFYSGPGCGRELIEKAKIEAPPLINFLEGDVSFSGATGSSLRCEKGHKIVPFSPRNKELYIAISLLFMLWGNVRAGKLKNCSEFISNNPDKDAFSSNVLSLNRAIESTSKNTNTNLTLTEMITNMAINMNKKPKTYTFSVLNNILETEFHVDKIWL